MNKQKQTQKKKTQITTTKQLSNNATAKYINTKHNTKHKHKNNKQNKHNHNKHNNNNKQNL